MLSEIFSKLGKIGLIHIMGCIIHYMQVNVYVIN